MKRIWLLVILLIAIFFRFNNLNWDSNFHLHPDERFLTMVGGAMKVPGTFFNYLNPQTSSLNPNNVGFKFFVYGVFPIVLNKILAVFFSNDNYNLFTIQGRFISGLADLFVVILIFKTVWLLEKKYKLNFYLKYWASFFYAIAVLPIQLSHFFAVDTFLNFFMFGSFYFAVRFFIVGNAHVRSLRYMLFSAIFFGLALASKITAIFILPLNLFFILFGTVSNRSLRMILQHLLLFGLIAYFTLRIANPYIFQSANLFDPRPDPLFIQNLKSLSLFEHKEAWYPPGVQWINKPRIFFSLVNIAFFGLGLPYFFLVILGFFNFIKDYKKKEFIFIALWLTAFFLYQSSQFAQTMRYFIFLYPFFAILAAVGLDGSSKFLTRLNSSLRSSNTKSRKNFVSPSIHVLLIVILLIWPLMFSSIYFRKNSRVTASVWIYENIPNNSIILSEHWDDALPLPISSKYPKQFSIIELPVFDPDTSEKWKKMDALLRIGDYYILSSNRGWGSIPTVPERYPRMTKFYKDLFAGKLSYKKIKEFTSYPKIQISKFKFQITDDSSDESFTVYDHPKVMIFKKLPQ